jgi:hypothetical protein
MSSTAFVIIYLDIYFGYLLIPKAAPALLLTFMALDHSDSGVTGSNPSKDWDVGLYPIFLFAVLCV